MKKRTMNVMNIEKKTMIDRTTLEIIYSISKKKEV